MSVATLLNRPEAYRVAIYRQSPSGVDAFGNQILAWSPLATSVPFRLDLGIGRLREEPFARVSEGNYAAYGLHLVGLVQGDGIEVTSALDPTIVGRRFVVERGKDYGPTGGWQGEVSESDEVFVEPAS